MANLVGIRESSLHVAHVVTTYTVDYNDRVFQSMDGPTAGTLASRVQNPLKLWIRYMSFFFKNYLVFGLRPSFGILETRKQGFGNWICFRPQYRGGGRHRVPWK
jgi:hypothetical protein